MLLQFGENRFGDFLYGHVVVYALDIHTDLALVCDNDKQRIEGVRNVKTEGVVLRQKGFTVCPIIEVQPSCIHVQIERQDLPEQTTSGDETLAISGEAKTR